MTALALVEFEPVHAPELAAVRLGDDGPALHCAFETSWCRNRSTLAGGLAGHHRWPKALGGPENPGEGLLLLCFTHHNRQHALIRAMVEAGTTGVRTVRYFAPIERETAVYAVGMWVGAGKPPIAGWSSPAAVLAA